MKYNSFVQPHFLKSLASVGSIVFISLLLLNPAPYVKIFQPTVNVSADFLYNGYDTSITYQLNSDDMEVTPLTTSTWFQTYEVKAGDSVDQIAQQYALSADQIKSVNNLIDNDLLIGQKLYLTSTQGVVYPVKEEAISLMVFANKYNVDLDRLKEINNQSNEMIPYERGQAIFVPGVTLAQAYESGLLIKPEPKPKPEEVTVSIRSPSQVRGSASSAYKATTSATQGATISSSQKLNRNVVVSSYRSVFSEKNGMAAGQCTYYAAHKATFAFPEISPGVRFRGFGGNANQRLRNAKNAGFRTSSTPSVGAIAVFQGWFNYYSGYGHVVIVEEVDSANKRIRVSEMNYEGIWIVTVRWIQLDDSMTKWSGLLGFIPSQPLPADLQAQYNALKG